MTDLDKEYFNGSLLEISKLFDNLNTTMIKVMGELNDKLNEYFNMQNNKDPDFYKDWYPTFGDGACFPNGDSEDIVLVKVRGLDNINLKPNGTLLQTPQLASYNGEVWINETNGEKYGTYDWLYEVVFWKPLPDNFM